MSTMPAPSSEAMSRSGKGTEADTEAGRSQPVEWNVIVPRLGEGGWFWLSTVRPTGRPHAVPLFAAWAENVFYIASNGHARKSRNLDENPDCVLTKDLGDVHLVVEGAASRVVDETGLRRASQAFSDVYEWPTRVVDGELDADYGAPTSGGPPYRVYALTPAKAFVFPTDETTTPTRVTF